MHRFIKDGIAAAGHSIVEPPTSQCYFNFTQLDKRFLTLTNLACHQFSRLFGKNFMILINQATHQFSWLFRNAIP